MCFCRDFHAGSLLQSKSSEIPGAASQVCPAVLLWPRQGCVVHCALLLGHRRAWPHGSAVLPQQSLLSGISGPLGETRSPKVGGGERDLLPAPSLQLTQEGHPFTHQLDLRSGQWCWLWSQGASGAHPEVPITLAVPQWHQWTGLPKVASAGHIRKAAGPCHVQPPNGL